VISVIVPTIDGRESYLKDCLASYAAHTSDYEVIVVPNKPNCGLAWTEGADLAVGSELHFSADDLQPHAGWSQAAMEVVERGFLPAPRILNTDGSLQSCGGEEAWEREQPTGARAGFSRIPFLSRQQWERIRLLVQPFLRDAHYFTDNAISEAARRCGIPTGVHRDFLFTHHLASAGRGAGTSWERRMQEDHQRFSWWVRGLPGTVR
jgi:hypothetical protein